MVLNFWRKEFKDKRTHERVKSNLFVQLFHDGSIYDGLVTNLSEIGMGFITEAYIPPGLILEIHTPYREDVLKVPVKINRAVKTGFIYDDFGAVVLNPSPDYLEFVCSLRSIL
jgi:hypothetical protein